ncbi:hypothetical protein SeMB42_g03413 [Synchytrium endobioticum]|uniref:Putative gamma-glutamylcyclotransferase n=1 Tax=Synchytrium endobioticum TaxID=286115 RepID=A0A507CVS4_9FUNG|nr:hypothetical protein SeLEV6574_g05228 [Synchytrium endobioticum]TPX47244.1 hypothetical protein SeMB42_g03413 [Synchytrium endobioticum]
MVQRPTPLFFYGTLQSPIVYARVISRHLGSHFKQPKNEPAILKGYKRSRVRNAVYPAITASPFDQVEGMIAYIETQKEVDILDVFEGDDYKRVPVKVLVKSSSTEADAEVYIWVAEDDYLEDCEWRLEQFEKGQSQQWVQDIDEFGNVDNMTASGTESVGGVLEG